MVPTCMYVTVNNEDALCCVPTKLPTQGSLLDSFPSLEIR